MAPKRRRSRSRSAERDRKKNRRVNAQPKPKRQEGCYNDGSPINVEEERKNTFDLTLTKTTRLNSAKFWAECRILSKIGPKPTGLLFMFVIHYFSLVVFQIKRSAAYGDIPSAVTP
jgi:hypothetical protein